MRQEYDSEAEGKLREEASPDVAYVAKEKTYLAKRAVVLVAT
jgi:hypothetical protein